MIKVIYNPLAGKIDAYYEGNITVDDILSYHDELKKIVPSLNTVGILSHFNNISISFQPSDLHIISNDAKDRLNVGKKIKIAFLTDNPMITAYIILYIKYLEENYHSCKVFCTEEAAMEWLSCES